MRICCEKIAGQAARRRARGGGGRCIDEIGNALRLHEVELAIQECALGELARFGDARAQLDAAREDEAQHRGSAVAVQFQDGFAGVRTRRREVQHQPVVERRTRRVAKGGDGRQAWYWNSAGHAGDQRLQAGA